MPRHKGLLAAVTAIAASFVTTSSVAAEPVQLRDVALEATYAGFARGKITDNEAAHPGYGYTVAYRAISGGEATIYIYDRLKQVIPAGPTSEVVREEFLSATRDVASVAEMTGTQATLAGRYFTGTPDRGFEFLCAEYLIHGGQGARRSFVYVTGTGKSFLKIRITLPTSNEADPAARNFADALASQLFKK